MPQSSLSGQALAQTLDELDRSRCQEMAMIARSQAKANVAQTVADIIENSIR